MGQIKVLESIERRGYAHPEALVTTEWVAEHLSDSSVRIIESNEDQLIYAMGHIPGAAEVDWTRDLNDPVRRDYLDGEAFGALLGRLGITPQTTIVFYGDRNNWWAAYAFWVFQLFGVADVRIMDGGRFKWEREGRPLTREVPAWPTEPALPRPRDDGRIRAYRDQVLDHQAASLPLIDVRSPQEFTGERLHLPEYPNEGALRGGHIPGAINIPWGRAVNPDDGTLKPADALRAIYQEECGLHPADDVIVYCRIGERSSHTWFVLSYLLGFTHVRNYDGSWTEWGNLVGAPIQK